MAGVSCRYRLQGCFRVRCGWTAVGGSTWSSRWCKTASGIIRLYSSRSFAIRMRSRKRPLARRRLLGGGDKIFRAQWSPNLWRVVSFQFMCSFSIGARRCRLDGANLSKRVRTWGLSFRPVLIRFSVPRSAHYWVMCGVAMCKVWLGSAVLRACDAAAEQRSCCTSVLLIIFH
jgi:hypothetical protein